MDNNSYYAKLAELLATHTDIWQASIVEESGSSPAKSGMKLAVSLTHAPFGNLGGGELEHKVIAYIRETKPLGAKLYSFALSPDGSKVDFQTSMICGGQVKVFIEALHLPYQLYIIGAGHCGRALGQLAKLCGFHVCLIDNREEIIAEDFSQYAHKAVLHDYSDLTQVINFSPTALVVIMTHGHLHDKEVLEQCLRKPLFYLGMIGSKTKVAQTFTNLMAKGFTEMELKKCHAPIGLAIGSQTPYEIAVSILAQLIALRYNKEV
ncbi:MAG: XdhC/CoxI family protein [Candidatus Cloacimonetes bacterium]|nr:XdhC/CoxI family protein [Candidatus Cloacimonadota bacterium]